MNDSVHTQSQTENRLNSYFSPFREGDAGALDRSSSISETISAAISRIEAW